MVCYAIVDRYNREADYLRRLTRLERIQEILNKQGRASVAELTSLLSASEATVRRDLDLLAKDGVARRVHGGACRQTPAQPEPEVKQRGYLNMESKARIGRRAAELIKSNQTVYLGTGSTVVELARNLRAHEDLTVITNSLPVINTLADVPEVKIVVTGGFLRSSEQSMIGHLVENALRELRADMVVIGIQGIHSEHGLTNDFLPEALIDRLIVRFAPELVVVCDSSKFGKIKASFVAKLDQVSTIVTDSGIEPAMRGLLSGIGIRVLIAE